MLSKVNLTTAREFTIKTLNANLVPFISGSPGGGKSAMIRSIAKDNKLYLIDIRLSQVDPVDLKGFGSIEDGRTVFCPPSMFPLEGLDEVPEGYNGWLIFFDEINAAPKAIQAASYKILLEREVGDHKLHSKVQLACAGNLMTDGAITSEIGTALRSRLVHIHVESDPVEFMGVAAKLQFDPRVLAFLDYAKNKLNTFRAFQDNNSSDASFACERTWEFVSNLCKVIEPDVSKSIPTKYTTLLAGTIGSTALEFVQFTAELDNMIPYSQITTDPSNVPIPDKAAVKYLLSCMLGNNVTESDADAVSKYVLRLPIEFQIVFFRLVSNRTTWYFDNEGIMGVMDNLGSAIYN